MIKNMFLFLIVFGFFSSTTFAGNDHLTWDELQESIDTIQKDNDKSAVCQNTWNLLWSEAKNGNLDARARLLLYTAPMPHAPSIKLPNEDNSKETYTRNAIILAANSLDAKLSSFKGDAEYSSKEYYVPYALIFLTDEAFKIGFPNIDKDFKEENFLKCLVIQYADKKEKNYCINEFYKNKTMPNFEEFSREIDMYINSGENVECNFQ